MGHRVHRICQQYPDKIAIKDGLGISLSYRELEKKARAIRDQLLRGGLKVGDKVAVFQEPTPDWICSMIAIFWAGGVYVPLVLLNPMPRLAAIMQAAKPTAILAHEPTVRLVPELQPGSANVINISLLSNVTGSKALNIPVSGEDPAVILFTSGSTGTPKGIVLRHRNLAHHIEGYVKAWSIGREVVLQQSAFSFDLSIGQIFTGLSMGGTLLVVAEETRRDPATLARLICEEKVTWTLLTPSEYSTLLEIGAEELRKASCWKHALSCGEALTRKLVREFSNLGHKTVRLYNAYGPAEAIISATMAEIPFRSTENDGPVTVGLPNPNYSICIVDDQCNPLPQGFPGEILIGGCGIATGYLDDEELTKEKFLTKNFGPVTDRERGWNMAYRTGDMGRLREDGALMYEGRREGDSQVKIRGFRVDLLDIEATVLIASNGVLSDAIVTMRTEAQVLVSHVIFAKGRQPQDSAAYLKALLPMLPLPAYMQPTIAVQIDNFPKNIHGKKDRSAIAKLLLPQELSSSNNAAELSPVEERLAQTWRKILPAEFAALFSIGTDTDFFAVGGNSLLLVKLQARIRGDFNVSLPLIQLFDVSSLYKMAARIEASRVVETIDWDQETKLDTDLLEISKKTLAQIKISNERGQKKGKTILLTGATGYFGPYLLRELIDDPLVETIHCVAVRGDSIEHAKSRISLSSSPKVVVHSGDLSSPHLGLSQEMVDHLTREIDIIIHSGATRSFWDSYYELRATNVSSTSELVRLAAPKGVPIHFLSTRGVLLLNSSINADAEASVAAFCPLVDGSEGYVASKWASEVLLEKAAHEVGVPVTIHRFTPRTTPNLDEINRAALEDLVESTLRLGKLPARSTWGGRIDVLHTERTARRIYTSDFEERIKFVHHQGEACLSPAELFDFLEEKLGERVSERLGLLEWVGAIKRTGYNWMFSTHHLTLTTTEHGVTTTLANRR